MKIRVPLEKEIQLAICQYLDLKGYLFWRQNTVGVFDAKAGFHRPMPKYAMKGVPDIIVVLLGGKFLGIEVKRPGGKQSEEQKTFEERCKMLKAGYLLATSVDDVINAGL